MKTPTVKQVATVFGVPEENVKAQYSKNAAQLRAMAKHAGSGQYRGKTGAQWLSLAEMAEGKAQS